MTTDAAPQPPPSAADLVAWTAAQTASFHSALAAAVTSYAATGVPPKSLTAGGDATADESGKKTRAKKDKDAPKRAPTPYNIFVKERAAVLKEKGFDPKAEHTTLMAKVADEWKAMSTSEKDAFTSNAIARGKAVAKGSGAHAALPAPATPAAGGGGDADDDEERRRRKAEKRARKEAAKAAALAAGGAAAKKHKHTHE